MLPLSTRKFELGLLPQSRLKLPRRPCLLTPRIVKAVNVVESRDLLDTPRLIGVDLAYHGP